MRRSTGEFFDSPLLIKLLTVFLSPLLVQKDALSFTPRERANSINPLANDLVLQIPKDQPKEKLPIFIGGAFGSKKGNLIGATY